MNYIWFFIVLISIVIGSINGKLDDVVNSMLSGAQKSIEVTLYLIGIMAFWLGIMKIAEKSGCINFLAKLIKPILIKLFPDLKDNNSVIGNIALNFTANAFGLSNAATPIGIKAMEEMQKENKDKKSASNSMCTLLAMNTAGFQLIPATVIAILVANGDKNPTNIILPTLIVTSVSFIFAIIIVKILEKVWTPQKEESKNV